MDAINPVNFIARLNLDSGIQQRQDEFLCKNRNDFRKQFSDAIDILTIASMLVSLLVIPVSSKLGAGMATRGTSPLSLASRTLIRQRFKKGRRTITWAKMLRGEWAYPTSVGTCIGRWLPWIGAVLTAYDLAMITRNVIHRYRLIVG
ncbi:STM2901 family protein [Pantoea sp. FN0307]|uniref:STM2901 family protein n=1 Tax=unclassified Pantoea TaxID=2630326 RepID=UPI003CF082F5